ncbi:MAG: V-type ATP synthase subunit D [Nitrospirae bacterium]|nr:V-type ATP synthase subunit D [Nitrospirota bacterium]
MQSLTKNELKKQKDNLKRYNRYLPTLYIKKHQLQKEIERINRSINALSDAVEKELLDMAPWIELLGEDIGLQGLISIKEIRIAHDNIAGVDIPVFSEAMLDIKDYPLDKTYPLWVDSALDAIARMLALRAEIYVLEEQKRCLSEELRATSQRVNLFEKVKIPESLKKIKTITIYLGDQQTAAVGWAIMAKKRLQGVRQ